MKKFLFSFLTIIFVLSFSINVNSQLSFFLEIDLDYPTSGMSDGKIVPKLVGSYPNQIEYHIAAAANDTIVSDSLINLDELYFSSFPNPVIIYAVDVVTTDTLSTGYFIIAGMGVDVLISCGSVSGPIDLTSCDGNLHGATSFALTSNNIDVQWKPHYLDTTAFILLPNWDSLDLNNLCPGYYELTFLDAPFPFCTSLYVEPLVASTTPVFNIEVLSSPSSPDSCTAIANSTVTGAIAPLQYFWDNVMGGNTQNNLCPGLHTLKVVDNNNDTASVLFGVADSAYFFDYTSFFSTPVDTIYFMTEDCGIDYGLPIDSIVITFVDFYNDSTVAMGFTIWQGFTTYYVQDTASYGPAAYGLFLIDLTQFCLNKVFGGDVIKFRGNYAKYLSIDETESDAILVYPNPANDIVIISGAEFETAKFYNSLGQHVLTSTSKTIDISSFAQGMYQLVLFDETGKLIGREKLIVQ